MGFTVNVVVGFVLSRVVVYYYSVIGLVAGALVFGVLSTWYAWRVMGELDYYYYSAYCVMPLVPPQKQVSHHSIAGEI